MSSRHRPLARLFVVCLLGCGGGTTQPITPGATLSSSAVDAPASPSVSASAPSPHPAVPSATETATVELLPSAVVPSDGVSYVRDQASLDKLMPRAIVRRGDLALGSRKIVGPCYDMDRHAALLAGLVKDDGTPLVELGHLAFDLDTDGKADQVIETSVTSTSRYAFYLRRGRCGYFVGEVEVRGRLSMTAERANGLAVLTATATCEHGTCQNLVRRVAFDGRSYAVDP